MRFGRWRGGGDLEHRLGRRGGTVDGGLPHQFGTVVNLLGTPSLSQAAAALGTTHQNARQLADALQRKGFLQISTDQADARVRRLSTTAKSTSYWRDRSAADQQQVLDWFGDLTPAEAQTLFDLLAKVEHRARAALGRPQQDRTQSRGPGPGPGPA